MPDGQKAVAEIANGLLHGAAQAVADARARIERILVVALDPAFGGASLVSGRREACSSRIEDGEVGKQTVGKDAVEVELQVAQLDEARTVAQQAKDAAVGDKAIELLVEVENSCTMACADMRRSALLGLAVEAGGLAVADDVHGGLRTVRGAVRDADRACR